MTRLKVAAVLFALTGAVACQRDGSSVDRKLDDISRRLASIEAKMGNAPSGGAGAAAAAPRPGPAQPNPASVYAVPVSSSDYIGPANAKVTIVEAFTFT